MSDIFELRHTYSPFEYPWAYEAWKNQQQSFWLPLEVNFGPDYDCFQKELSDTERHLITSVLRGFTINELFIGNEYWSGRVAKALPKPEIIMACLAIASVEMTHLAAYGALDQTLGLDSQAELFLQDPIVKEKINRMIDTPFKTKEDIALSIAVFSAFTESVHLFSSFLILINFSRFNKMKALSQIIGWSAMDETLHGNFGIKCFRTIVEENPEIWTDDFKKKLYDAARYTVELEDRFLEQAFSLGPIEGLTIADMKAFIRHRCNLKLNQLGLKTNWKNIDKEAIERLGFFDVMINSNNALQDFFSGKVTSYSKVSTEQSWDNIWDDTNIGEAVDE